MDRGTEARDRQPGATGELRERVLRCCLLSETPLRDRAILQLFLDHACSVPDVLGLRLEDVDLQAGTVRWRLRHPAPVPAAAGSLERVRDYVQRERRSSSRHLFVTRLGLPLAEEHVRTIFAFARREAELGWLTPETLRTRLLALLAERDPAGAWLAHRRGLRYSSL